MLITLSTGEISLQCLTQLVSLIHLWLSLTENINSFHFYGNSITSFLGGTFSRKNVHFNHPSFHLRNYHANASSVTPSECHFLYCKVYYVFGKTLTSITLSFTFFESTLCFILLHKHIPADESGQRSSR